MDILAYFGNTTAECTELTPKPAREFLAGFGVEQRAKRGVRQWAKKTMATRSFTGTKPSRAMFPAVLPFYSAPKSAAVGTG